MKKIKLCCLLLILVTLIACNIGDLLAIQNNTPRVDNTPYWEPAETMTSAGNSSVYPYGLVLQKHAGSPSVNSTSYFSTTLNETVGNDAMEAAVRRIVRPDYAIPETYDITLYFDSNAADGGDGSIEAPYNNLDGLTDGSLIEDNQAYLIKADSVFMSSCIRIHYDETHSNVYIGSYGEGQMPIICNADSFDNPTANVGRFWFHGENLAVNGLHLISAAGNSYSQILDIEGDSMTFANSHIEGIKDTNGRYPTYGIKGGCNNLTLYNTEFAYVRMDMFYLSSNFHNYQFVSNYFHHCNISSFEGIYEEEVLITPFDPEDRSTWVYKSGDIIQFEGATPVSSYFANNIFDRGDTPGKFCFIINGGTSIEDVDGTTIEYNTFISPLASDFGGAGCYIMSGVYFNDNLFLNTDPEGGVSGLSAFTSFNYGLHYNGNYFINYDGSEIFNGDLEDFGEDNRAFTSLSEYRNETAVANRKGSNLF